MDEKILGYDTTIPMAMWHDKNLEPIAIKLYAHIRNLANMRGYCFASNKYLSELMGCSESTIERKIRQLKTHLYLEIDTDKNNIHWQRRIYISDKFKKSLRTVTDDGGGRHPCRGGSSPVTAINNKREIEKDNPPPLPPPRKEIPKTKSWEEWRMRMISLGFTVEDLAEAWKRYYEQPPDTIKNPKRWLEKVLESVRDERLAKNSENNPENIVKSNREYAKNIYSKASEIEKQGFYVYGDHVTVKAGENSLSIIYYDEPRFKEKFDGRIKNLLEAQE
jgi:biotin operon repressor